jgi:hypothetical protein
MRRGRGLEGERRGGVEEKERGREGRRRKKRKRRRKKKKKNEKQKGKQEREKRNYFCNSITQAFNDICWILSKYHMLSTRNEWRTNLCTLIFIFLSYILGKAKNY